MCSLIDTTNVPEGGFTAEEDILCYKILVKPRFECENLKSHYFDHAYAIGRQYVSPAKIEENPMFLGHFMKKKMLAAVYMESLDAENFKYPGFLNVEIIGDVRKTDLHASCGGFHSYTRYMNGDMRCEMRCRSENLVAVRCRIPKGSSYYVSDDGMTYVSDSIVIDSIVKKKTD